MVFIIANYSINRIDAICLIQDYLMTVEVVHESFIQCEFKVSENSSSSFIRRPFSFNVIRSSFLTFLFVRNGDIEFQKFLLVKGWFSVYFAKYYFIAVFITFVHLFFICLWPTKLCLDGHLLHLFLILDLVIIALPSSFVIKAA